MCRNAVVVAAGALTILSITRVQAQTGTGGLYRITSGHYSQCCGVGGVPTGYDLPHPQQSYVRFTIVPQTGLASLSFLADDGQTVFSTVPCPSAGVIDFRLDYGFPYQGHTFFHVDPGPPPYGKY